MNISHPTYFQDDLPLTESEYPRLFAIGHHVEGALNVELQAVRIFKNEHKGHILTQTGFVFHFITPSGSKFTIQMYTREMVGRSESELVGMMAGEGIKVK